MWNRLFSLVLLSIGCLLAKAQGPDLQLRGQFKDGVLKLRWSSSSIDVLHAGFIHGYLVEIQPLDQPGGASILREIKANPGMRTRLDTLSHTDQYVYAFFDTLRQNIPVYSDPQVAQWRNISFLFGLQNNYPLSEKLGMATSLSGLDTLISYRASIRINTNTMPGQLSATIDIRHGDFERLIKPAPPTINCWKNRLQITGWITEGADAYAAFFLTRHSEGESRFSEVHAEPLAINYALEVPQVYYVDSIRSEQAVAYRLQGKNAWGDWGPPSDTVWVEPCLKSKSAPVLSKVQETDDRGKVDLFWFLPDTLSQMPDGYHIYRSESKFGTYHRITDFALDANLLSFQDESPIPRAYYQVEAIYGQETRRSISRLATLIDLKAPPVPDSIMIDYDTSDHSVQLSWQAAPAEDREGFKVYLSHNALPTGPKILLTNIPLQQTYFKEVLSPASLQKQRFYWVTSIDWHGNESSFSTAVRLKLPDRFAPVPPRITQAIPIKAGVQIKGFYSPSSDVATHFLCKVEAGTEDTICITLPASIFRDSLDYVDSVEVGKVFQYWLNAEDSSGNVSSSNLKKGSPMPSLRLPLIEFYQRQVVDENLLIVFDYLEGIPITCFAWQTLQADATWTTTRCYAPEEIIMRKMIRKRGSPGTYSLFQIIVPPEMEAMQFRLQAVGATGYLSSFTPGF